MGREGEGGVGEEGVKARGDGARQGGGKPGWVCVCVWEGGGLYASGVDNRPGEAPPCGGSTPRGSATPKAWLHMCYGVVLRGSFRSGVAERDLGT